jgi:hypothetical protein
MASRAYPRRLGDANDPLSTKPSQYDASLNDTPDEKCSALMFLTEADAVAAFLQTNRIYEECALRQEKVFDRLVELDALEDDGAE